MTLAEDARRRVRDLCESLYASKGRGFGNGRAVRKLFERTLENQSERIVAEDGPLLEIVAGDIPAGI